MKNFLIAWLFKILDAFCIIPCKPRDWDEFRRQALAIMAIEAAIFAFFIAVAHHDYKQSGLALFEWLLRN